MARYVSSDRGQGWILAILVGVVMLGVGTLGKGLIASQASYTGPMLIVFGIGAVAWGLWEWLRPEKKPPQSTSGKYR